MAYTYTPPSPPFIPGVVTLHFSFTIHPSTSTQHAPLALSNRTRFGVPLLLTFVSFRTVALRSPTDVRERGAGDRGRDDDSDQGRAPGGGGDDRHVHPVL